MTRNEYVENRKAALSTLSTENLAITIGEYFDQHATMPGEKDLKAAAEKIVANIAENADFDIDADTKAAMIDRFANIAVREMKVEKLQVQNVTKANKDDFSVLKATDLGLTETDAIPAEGKTPAKKVYEVAAQIKDGDVYVGEYAIGSLGSGFVKNNPGVKCDATVVATDYSNGKMTNMSYTVIADIAAPVETEVPAKAKAPEKAPAKAKIA